MKRFLFWTTLVLVLAAAAVAPTLWALHNRTHSTTPVSVPDGNVVHVNVAPTHSSEPAG
jgi:multidrug resistance efflux pump